MNPLSCCPTFGVHFKLGLFYLHLTINSIGTHQDKIELEYLSILEIGVFKMKVIDLIPIINKAMPVYS